MKLYPVGKGMYIWQVANILGGDLVQMAAQAKALQLDWVSLKVADGSNAFQPALLAPAVQAFKDAGLRVWG